MQLISSQCRSRGNLGAKIFEGMFAAMPSYASNAAAVVCSLNHAPCREVTTRYLAAFLNDMARSSGLIQELIDGNQKQLQVRKSTTHLSASTQPPIDIYMYVNLRYNA